MQFSLKKVKKEHFEEYPRTRSEEETLSVAEPITKEIGVSEITEITSSDRTGLPCMLAYRPRTAIRGVKVHPGKGLTQTQARVSAMMAAIECYSAEYHRDPMEFASVDEIGLLHAINPEDLILPADLPAGEKIHWSPCHDLISGEDLYVPSNAVFHPYDTLGMTFPLFKSDMNGVAWGNVMEEAVLYAMLEVIKRDALSCAEQAKDMGLRLVIDKDCAARALLERFEEQGIRIHLWFIEGRTGIPTVAAAADDTVTLDPTLLVMGTGTHTDPALAALHALMDAAKARAGNLYGIESSSRRHEILLRAGYDRMKRINHEWFADAEEIAISSVADQGTPYFDQDIRVVIEALRPHTDRICVCDLTRTAFPVVRVVIPGMEVSYLDKDRIRER